LAISQTFFMSRLFLIQSGRINTWSTECRIGRHIRFVLWTHWNRRLVSSAPPPQKKPLMLHFHKTKFNGCVLPWLSHGAPFFKVSRTLNTYVASNEDCRIPDVIGCRVPSTCVMPSNRYGSVRGCQCAEGSIPFQRFL
jgi:hypothetical protein